MSSPSVARRVAISEDGRLAVRMTLTAPNCPMADVILSQVESKLRALEGVSEVNVEIVWEPKWNPDMMTEAARLELEFTGHTGPAHLRKDSRYNPLTIGRKSPRKPGR